MDIDTMKKCLVCGLIITAIVEPTAICFAYHKPQDSSIMLAAAPAFHPYKSEPAYEYELHPHNHSEDQSPSAVKQTIDIASGSARKITKTLTYMVNVPHKITKALTYKVAA